jgi:hypothetical protein
MQLHYNKTIDDDDALELHKEDDDVKTFPCHPFFLL